MKSWVGISIIIIGIIHSVFGFVFFHSTIIEVFYDGFVNTVNMQPMREWGFWFLFFGFLLIILGLLVDWCERKKLSLPKFFGWMLLVFTSLLVIIMPFSGGWLMFIPSIGLIVRKQRPKNMKT